MGSIVVKLPKDERQFKEMLVKTGVVHVHKMHLQPIFGKFVTNKFIVEKDESFLMKGVHICAVNVYSHKDIDYYYVVFANKLLDFHGILMIFQPLSPWVLGDLREYNEFLQTLKNKV